LAPAEIAPAVEAHLQRDLDAEAPSLAKKQWPSTPPVRADRRVGDVSTGRRVRAAASISRAAGGRAGPSARRWMRSVGVAEQVDLNHELVASK
jgi:hypothetical protein